VTRPVFAAGPSTRLAITDHDRVALGRAEHDTVRGRAALSWRRSVDGWRLAVEVPADAMATVRLPGVPANVLGCGRHVVEVPLVKTGTR
jgi:hypothetical protein